ncbi:MAG TPA: IS1 family transposase [Thermoanaerobaculia bacterium]|nr:IS1 family transposase [Thermoanaerobaculia bacterium]
MANVLSAPKRVQIVSALVEGCGIRATARMAGVSKDTVMKLWREIGEACIRLQDKELRNLSCKRLQVDEVWSFVYAKEKNVPQDRLGEFGVGDVWTFTAIDAETKLIPSFLVGSRDSGSATAFMEDLAGRLENRVQLTTDGHKMYLSAVEDAFSAEIDFAQLVKIYGAGGDAEHRYSPAECIGCERHSVTGNPDAKHVSTSYIERSNLTVRMSVRRFTRLTNAFSKKLENHVAAFGLFTAHYNFCRIHQTLRVSPAMAAGVTDRLWSIADLVALLPAAAAGQKRGPYKGKNSN